MEKQLQQGLIGNFNEKNLESVDKFIEEPMPEKFMVMILDELGNGEEPKIIEESRKRCVKDLLR